MTRLFLGSWTCPTGNAVDVYLTLAAGDTPTVTGLSCEWDRLPPSRSDLLHWQRTVLPEVGQAVVNVTGLRTMVMRL